MNHFWEYVFLNNTVRDWAIAIGIIIVCLIVLLLWQRYGLRRIKALADRTNTTIDDFLVSTIDASVIPLLYVMSFYFGLQYLTFPARVMKVMHIGVMVVITFFILRILSAFVGYLFRQSLLKQDDNDVRKKQSKGMLIIVQIFIWLIGFIFLIDNLGYDITTLIAGLGIGGIAIALAAQTILGDLFNSFVIYFDKPFEIGDFIIVDDKMGTVEHVGIKTTRIRALSGEQLIFSNSNLTNARVHNYRRMLERRALFTFGVAYHTPPEKLEQISGWVKEIIEGIEGTRFDRAHFKLFGDFSLNFEVVYFVLSPEMATYLDVQQKVNLKLVRLFREQEIEFAFPTQTLYLHKVNDDPASSELVARQ